MLLFIFVILSGCSTNVLGNVSVSDEGNQYVKEYAPNPQVPDDRTLEKVGQNHLDEKGEVTLKAINNVNKTYQIGEIELTIVDAKKIHLTPDYSLIDYFNNLTYKEQFEFVKVFVEITNTSNDPIKFAPVAMMETSTGEEIPWENDIYLENLNGEIGGNETKYGNVGFIIENTDIDSFEITTSAVFDNNDKEMSKEKKIEIVF